MNIAVLPLLVVAAALSVSLTGGGAEARKVTKLESTSASTDVVYNAISCRAHSASVTDFGAVGDGQTSNTKAFQDAVKQLSRFASDGGVQLYVPAGKWLTGSFSLTSHFTLYLHRDAVLLASQ
ncbi:hypothetical protein CRG98_041339, partial [Punica granatum]